MDTTLPSSTLCSLNDSLSVHLSSNIHTKRQLYSVAIPIIVLLALVVMLVNGALLLACRLIKSNRSDSLASSSSTAVGTVGHFRPPNPTLRLTISLAASDLFTSIAMTFSVVYNSYLYSVLGYSTNACVSLTFEAIRTGGLITGTWHLLALAVSHYLNIAHPSTYKEILTPRKTRWIIRVLWSLPPTALLLFMVSTPGQGFLTPYHPCSGRCWRLGVWSTFQFRLIIFFVFFWPFSVMSGLYVKFLALSRRQDRLVAPSRALTRKRRTFMTTVWIWTTFFLLWIPACLVFLLTCGTCPLKNDARPRLVFAAGVLSNLCILLKSLINPIIYAVRIPEIRAALTKQYGFLLRPRSNCAAPDSNQAAVRMSIQDVGGNTKLATTAADETDTLLSKV